MNTRDIVKHGERAGAKGQAMTVVELDGTKTVHAHFEVEGQKVGVEIAPFPLCNCPPQRFQSSLGCVWCAPHEAKP